MLRQASFKCRPEALLAYLTPETLQLISCTRHSPPFHRPATVTDLVERHKGDGLQEHRGRQVSIALPAQRGGCRQLRSRKGPVQ